jgi:hypothetical protein
MLPLAFERAAKNSFVNPKFDSQVLEEQYQASIFPQIRLRFRWVVSSSILNYLRVLKNEMVKWKWGIILRCLASDEGINELLLRISPLTWKGVDKICLGLKYLKVKGSNH